MFFDKEFISFNLLDVLSLRQKNINTKNVGRNFNAISFRLSSDAVIKTKQNEYHMRDNCVAYFPARYDYQRIANNDELIVVHFNSTDYHTEDIEFFEAQSPGRFKKFFEDILACWSQKEVGYKYKCSALLYEIFAECYAQNYKNEIGKSKIKASVEYIHKSYKKSDLTIKEIADKSFMSEVYFRKIFKEEYGVSPQKYIIDLRIQNAVGLISAGYYSLKEIAYLSGYNDYKYFSVEFKRNIGISPSEYLYNYE
ncbi:MAG: AraC family transcriptional regulator [Clostridia bacterium]|nr:AraC family transcriptional regulator [Clostridia bacterium]